MKILPLSQLLALAAVILMLPQLAIAQTTQFE
jgi:hypothetical protein